MIIILVKSITLEVGQIQQYGLEPKFLIVCRTKLKPYFLIVITHLYTTNKVVIKYIIIYNKYKINKKIKSNWKGPTGPITNNS